MEQPQSSVNCLNTLATMVLQDVAAHTGLPAPIRAALIGTTADLAQHATDCFAAESETVLLLERIGRAGGAAA